jgi:hypothetical protein
LANSGGADRVTECNQTSGGADRATSPDVELTLLEPGDKLSFGTYAGSLSVVKLFNGERIMQFDDIEIGRQEPSLIENSGNYFLS